MLVCPWRYMPGLFRSYSPARVFAAREVGFGLYGHPAVDPMRRIINGGEDVAGVGNGFRAELEDGVLDAGASCCLLRDSRVIFRTRCDGGMEDAGVGGDTGNGFLLNQLPEAAGPEAAAGEIVQSDGNAGVAQLLCGGSCHVITPWTRGLSSRLCSGRETG